MSPAAWLRNYSRLPCEANSPRSRPFTPTEMAGNCPDGRRRTGLMYVSHKPQLCRISVNALCSCASLQHSAAYGPPFITGRRRGGASKVEARIVRHLLVHPADAPHGHHLFSQVVQRQSPHVRRSDRPTMLLRCDSNFAHLYVAFCRSDECDGGVRVPMLSPDVEESDLRDSHPTAERDRRERTRSLLMAGAGSWKVAARSRHLEDLVPAVVAVAKASPGITGYGLTEPLRAMGATFQRGEPVRAARLAADRGLLRVEDGARGSKKYFAAPPIPTYPDLSQRDTSPPIPTSLYRGGVGGRGQVSGDLSQDQPPALCKVCGTELHEILARAGEATHHLCRAGAAS